MYHFEILFTITASMFAITTFVGINSYNTKSKYFDRLIIGILWLNIFIDFAIRVLTKY